MTLQQREKRKAYQREYMRKRRAQQKAQRTATTGVKPQTLQTPAPAAKAVRAPIVKPAVRAQDLASYDDLSSQKAKVLQKAWKQEARDYLLDVLTRPESPLTGAGMQASRSLVFWFGLSEKLDRIVEQEKPEQTQEFTLAIMLECLRRLTGEKKTGSAPAVPAIAQKPVQQRV
jgi:hypothetical protein